MFDLPHVLASKYRLVRHCGEGGMGVVYAADHLELKTRVAIKFLQPRLARDASARARFLREARLAASVEGEHSARIRDVGTDEVGRAYIVMEYLAGETADERLAREQKLSVSDAATVMVQLLDALAEAHAKGLVHRDLKPANIFLVEQPGEAIWVKVLDFGISKVVSQDVSPTASTASLTEPRTLLGSPQYMSPEQLRESASVDARSDIWACGVVFFELLTGQAPFEGATLADLYAQIVSGVPRTLASAGGGGVPSPIARVIERCLRKDASERPQSAYDLAVAIAPFANESTRALLPRIRAWCKTEVAIPEGSRSRRAVVGGLALVGAAAVAAFAAASFTSRGAPEAASIAAASVPTGAVSAEIRALDPIAAAPSFLPAAAPAPSTTSSSDAAASATSTIRRPRAPTPPRPTRIQDLDGIELIK